jgi:DNA repair protein RecN (Recombination protein N)
MISRLSISNYLLIDQLELEWHPALNIITGETGAGKSILMDALGLLAGDRADPKCLRNPEKKCCIEAWFKGNTAEIPVAFAAAGLEAEAENILRREILPGGKSRSFINDTPVTLEVLRSLSVLLFDIHGQQDSLLLGNSDMQFRLLDVLAGSRQLRKIYLDSYNAWKESLRRLDAAVKSSRAMAAELDYKQFLWNELSETNLQPGEQQELESRLELQRNAGDILSRLRQSAEALEGGPDLVGTLKQLSLLLARVASISPRLDNVAQRLNSAHLELKDIAFEIRDLEAGMEVDPRQMETDEERLNRIYHLQKKHRLDSVAGLISLQEELDAWLQQQGKQDEELDELQAASRKLEENVLRLGRQLHQERSLQLDRIAGEVLQLLAAMAMPAARFSIQLEELPQPGPDGIASIRYLFSANPGIPLSDLKQAASGGEFSRLMLAFKFLMATRTEMPSLIFDEIDTGISGEVAMRVGKLIQSMAERHQVLVITHSAQMASRAQAHWKVEKSQEKESTETRVRHLSAEDSLQEIAAMISGNAPGKAALEAARELINA